MSEGSAPDDDDDLEAPSASSSFDDLLRGIAHVPRAPLEDAARGELEGTERFAIVRRLGEGGFGIVYEALDRERGGVVALKLLKRPRPSWLMQFKREFRALAGVVHPNLVTLHELAAERGQWFFTMELIDGEPLLRRVGVRAAGDASVTRADTGPDATPRTTARETSGPPGEREAPFDAAQARLSPHEEARLRRAFVDLASGVGAIHDAGKLHCDLKPSNVLMTAEGRVTILDFGLVADRDRDPAATSDRAPLGAAIDDDDTASATRTSPSAADPARGGGVRGTPAYMAPEQTLGAPATPASDWYAVGVMLYEALTGGLPFTGSSALILARKRVEDPLDPRELGAALPGDLCDLCLRLLSRDPALRPGLDAISRALVAGLDAAPHAPTVAPIRPGPSPVIVGRQRHLAALERALDEAVEGQTVVAHVRGPSGMGKTTLVRRFLEDTLAGGRALVLEARCYERESVPYKALDGVVDGLSDHLRTLAPAELAALAPGELPALVRVFPVLGWAQAERVSAADDGDLVAARTRAFDALRELVARLAAGRPLVVAIDDLQWGDADGAALLLHLLAPPDAPPMLLVASYRSEDAATSEAVLALRGAPFAASARHRVVDVEVGALDTDEAMAVVSALGADVEGARALAADAEGSPLFLHELVRHVRTGAAAGGTSLRDLLVARTARLPPDAQRLLEIVAVAGQPIEAFAAEGAAGLAGFEAFAALSVLRAGSLVRTRGPRTGDAVEAFHDRIREVVVAALAPATVGRHHRALAAALEATGRADPERLALHWAGAGEPSRARVYDEQAGDRSARALAFDRAAAHYRAAIGRTGAAAHGLHEKLGDALASAGHHGGAAEAYLVACAGLDEGGGQRLRRRAADQLLRSGRIDEGRELLRSLAAPGSSWAPPRDASLHDEPPRGLSTPSKVRALHRAQLFAGLTAEHLEEVSALAAVRALEAGETVVREGESGDALFLVASGKLAVLKDGAKVRELEAGAVFGEVSVLDGSPRSATVEAVSASMVLRIGRSDFERLLDRYPELARGVIRALLGYAR